MPMNKSSQTTAFIFRTHLSLMSGSNRSQHSCGQLKRAACESRPGGKLLGLSKVTQCTSDSSTVVQISNVFKQVGDQASPELPASCIKNKITWHCGNLKNNYEINNNHTHIHTITSSTTILSSARLDLMLATSATARVKESKRQSTKKMLAWKKINRLCKALKYNYQVSNNETANYEATTQKTQRRLRSYLNLAKTENNNKHRSTLIA